MNEFFLLQRLTMVKLAQSIQTSKKETFEHPHLKM